MGKQSFSRNIWRMFQQKNEVGDYVWSDRQLVEVYQARSETKEVIQELMRRYEGSIMGHFINRIKSRNDAGDLMQELYIKLERGLRKADMGDKVVKAYIITTTKNLVIDERKKTGRRRVVPIDGDDSTPPPTHLEDGSHIGIGLRIDRAEIVAKIKKELNNDRRFSIYLLRIMLGFPRRDICKILGITEGEYDSDMKVIKRVLKGIKEPYNNK